MSSPEPANNLGIGPRVAAFLRGRYSRPMAKHISRDFDVSEQTANRWLQDHAPTTAHLEEMAARWGRPFLEALFVEAFAAKDARADELARVVGEGAEVALERLASSVAELPAASLGPSRRMPSAVVPDAAARSRGEVRSPTVFPSLRRPLAEAPSPWEGSALFAQLLAELPPGAPSPTLPRSAGEGDSDSLPREAGEG